MPALSIFNKKNPNPYSCKKRAPILAESNSSEVHWLFNAQFLRGSSTAAEAKSRSEFRLKRLKKKFNYFTTTNFYAFVRVVWSSGWGR